MKPAEWKPNRGRPRGFAIAAVLACLLVVMLLSAALTRRIVTEHRQTRTLARQGQAFWIAESAVQRALFHVRNDPKYRGETWKIPASQLGAGASGRAEITVTERNDPASSRQITIRAYYPDRAPARVLVERRLVVRNINNSNSK